MLDSRNLYNLSFFLFNCHPLNTKHKENVYNTGKAFYFIAIKKKKKKNPIKPANYSGGGGRGGNSRG